jgi:DNA polymerase
MALSKHQHERLEALGIVRWVRQREPVPENVASTVVIDGAAHTPDPPVQADADTLDIQSMAWPALETAVRGCTACSLHATRQQAVVGVGNHQAEWMIVGEAPGEQEDIQGEPFVGRAGLLLNNMLTAVGLSRASVYIANVIKCRPPGNRDPKPEETTACIRYLERQIALIEPKMLLVVGRIAAQTLLGTDSPVGQLRGRIHHYGEQGIPLVVTYHPAYLLRRPAEKAKAWDDLKLALAQG